MSLISLPAPLTLPPTGRDLPYVTRVYIRAQIDQLRATDDEIEHDFQTLNQIYPNELINNYDLVCMGFTESAELLASQIPASLVASAYLDIGYRAGLTTLACTKKLLETAKASGTTVTVRVVDGLAKIVKLASRKIFSAAGDNPTFTGVRWKVGDILRDASFLSTTIPQFEPPCLGTAQRVFLNVRVDQQARQLSQWFAALRPGGALILDVGHPQRDISAIFVGPGQVDQRAKRAVWHRCIQFCDDATFEECREHARRLAAETGLTITNTMPAQLPVATENGMPLLTAWIDNTRATTLTDDLTREERAWFCRRYVQDSIHYYRGRGFACAAEVAAVVAVFQRAVTTISNPSFTPLPSAPALTGSTKYDIDPTLSGKAREKAKKNAAKKIKEAARQKDENGNNGMGGAGGASGASTSV